MENILRENRSEAMELKKERDDYKAQFKLFCEQQKQYQLRESTAHAKIQEAIQTVEIAIAEKNAALQREKEIRGTFSLSLDSHLLLVPCRGWNWFQSNPRIFFIDECDQLALTIGRIMEEAGDRMEGNIDEIKINYSQRMQKLEDIIKKVKIQLIFNAPLCELFSWYWLNALLVFTHQLIVSKETLAKNNQLSKKHIQDLQLSLSKLVATNDALNADLQTASKTIVSAVKISSRKIYNKIE